MTEPVAADLDVEYLRLTGEEIRARLFPAANRRTGQQPLPLPVALDYELPSADACEVLFVPERIIQRVAGGVEDVRPSVIAVFVDGESFGQFDLAFGTDPKDQPVDRAEYLPTVMPLLRAVAGVL